MAKSILVASSRHRNSNLKIESTDSGHLSNRCSDVDALYFLSSRELNALLGLALTAVMAEGKDIAMCRLELNIFLKYRDFIQQEDVLTMVVISIVQLLESGFAAFHALDYPRYYDEFVTIYRTILTASKAVPPSIKDEMQRIWHERGLS